MSSFSQIPVPPKEPITVEWMKSRVESVDKQIKAIRLKEKNFKSAIGNDRVRAWRLMFEVWISRPWLNDQTLFVKH